MKYIFKFEKAYYVALFSHDRDSETPFYTFEVEIQNKDEEPDVDLDIIVGNSDFYGDTIVILMCFAVVCQV